MKFELPMTWRVAGAVVLFSVACSGAHEMSHHFTSAAVCGRFGRMSFGLFTSSEACANPVPGEAVGPLFTYLFAIAGAWLIARGGRPLLGYAMVVASHSWLRMISIVAGGGDEAMISRALTGENHRAIIIAIATVLTLPPLVIAYRALRNRMRPLVFLTSLLLPFFVALLPIKMIDDLYFAANVRNPEVFHKAVVGGIPVAVVTTYVASMLLFALFGWKQLRDRSVSAVLPFRE